MPVVERVRWVTNLAPPYRGPLWESLGALRELEVATLATTEPNRRWSTPDGTSYRRSTLGRPRLKVQRGGATHHVYSRGLLGGVRRNSALILPGWENPASWLLLVLARLTRVPYFAFVESTSVSAGPGSRLLRRPKQWFHRSATGCVVVGARSAAAVAELGVEPARIVLCPNSVQGSVLWATCSGLRDGSERRPGHVYLFCGQLIERKRPDLVVRAFAAVRCPGDTLVLAGEGPRESALRALVVELGLRECVTFLGYVDDEEMAAVWAGAHTLVLPSEVEVWGFVVAEALAAGLNVVVTDRAGIFADVDSEPGVFGVQPSESSVVDGMRRSVSAWQGWIYRSSQMERCPQSSAEQLMAGIDRIVAEGAAR